MSREGDDPALDAGVGSFDEIVSVVGDETRLRILIVLTRAVEEGDSPGLSFSELRDRVGVEDSGRFNYHLDKLRDTFVAKVDDRYVARGPGRRVVTSMYAGRYDDTAEEWTVETPSSCHQCGEPLRASYKRRRFGSTLLLECPEHGQHDRLPLLPGATEGREPLEVVRVAYRYAMSQIRMAHAGICSECLGPTSVTYPADPVTSTFPDDRIPTRISCDRCWLHMGPPVQNFVLMTPRVRGRLRAHGYGLLESMNAVKRPAGPVAYESTLVSETPARATVRFGFPEETITVTVDDQCRVVEFDRE